MYRDEEPPSISSVLIGPLPDLFMLGSSAATIHPRTLLVKPGTRSSLVHAVVSLPLLDVEVGVLRALFQPFVIARNRSNFAAYEWRELCLVMLIL
jgi:branched-subunit amino acid transport protein